MIRRPPRSTLDRSSAASDVYKRQISLCTREFRKILYREFKKCLATTVPTYSSGSETRSPEVWFGRNFGRELRIFSSLPEWGLRKNFGCLLYTSDAADERS